MATLTQIVKDNYDFFLDFTRKISSGDTIYLGYWGETVSNSAVAGNLIRYNGVFWEARSTISNIGAAAPTSTLWINCGVDGFTFQNVADMKASKRLDDLNLNVEWLGYYNAGDGGGNKGVVVAAGTATDDGGSYITITGSANRQVKALFPNEYYAPEQWGARGNETTDDGPAIQKAQTYIENNGGGTLSFSAKTYLINTPVVCTNGGVYWMGKLMMPFTGAFASNTPQQRGGGTWLKTTNTTDIAIDVQAYARGMGFENFGLIQPSPNPGAGWTPTAYNYFIGIQADDSVAKNILFFPVYNGISYGKEGQSMGRAVVESIKGEAFNTGIDLVFSADVIKLHNIHLYPYWSHYESNVKAYSRANATGILSRRSDNTLATNIFCFGFLNGIKIGYTPDGPTAKFKIVNYDGDDCSSAIRVESDNNSISVVNATSQGGLALLNIDGNSNEVYVERIAGTILDQNVIRDQGTNNFTHVSGFRADRWNQTGAGYPAVEVVDASSTLVMEGHAPQFLSGGNGSYYGGAGNITAKLGGGRASVSVDGNGHASIAIPGGTAPNRVQVTHEGDVGTDITIYPYGLSTSGFNVKVNYNGSTATSGTFNVIWDAYL